MIIVINGEEQEVEQSLSLSQLLSRLGLSPGRVAVEVNREVVPRTSFDERFLGEGDSVEIVHFVGGGV